jgi:hypothetical protein
MARESEKSLYLSPKSKKFRVAEKQVSSVFAPEARTFAYGITKRLYQLVGFDFHTKVMIIPKTCRTWRKYVAMNDLMREEVRKDTVEAWM